MSILKAHKPVTAPFGIPVAAQFYAHNTNTTDYKDAAKIKTLDVHPAHSWVATGDEDGNVVIWDFDNKTVVTAFTPDAIKESQRVAVEALEAHVAFATAQSVAVPDVAGPGLGMGMGGDPGASAGSATESFISSVISGAKRKSVLERLPEDIKTSKTGKVRALRFADEHVLGLCCGLGKGDYEDLPQLSRDNKLNTIDPFAREDGAIGVDDLCASVDDALARLSYATDTSSYVPNSTSSTRQVLHAPHQWLIVICEQRVLLMDYSTRATVDIPPSALLIEASSAAPLSRTLARGRPAVHSATLIGSGIIAFGCEDGIIRVWHSDYNATIQTLKASPAGRTVTQLFTCSTSPHAVGTSKDVLNTATQPRTLLVSGTSDGYISVWEIIAGKQVVDNGKFGVQHFKLGGELLELSVNPITMHALAVSGDRMVTSWDLTVRPAVPGTAPKLNSSRLVTSSAAAETGLGSRMLSACSLGAHPFFPPAAVVAASKGPHLEIGIVGSSEKGADSGTIFYDLRTARPGLPTKCKIYTMAPHPFRPDIIVAGTNIGIFVVQVAPHYSMRACSIDYPCRQAPANAAPESASYHVADTAGASRLKETSTSLYVNASGMLVAAETTVDAAQEAQLELEEGDAAETVSPSRLPSMRAAPSVAITVREQIAFPSVLPPAQPSATVGPGSAGNPNALSAVFSYTRSPGLQPGTRGVRLRLSGSGRYLAAIWPECKCYTIYRLYSPALDGSVDWSAEVVDSGSGVDIAWCASPKVDYADSLPLKSDDSGEASKAPSAGAGSSHALHDRFVVVEPGIPVAVKKVYGGGMPIGAAPPTKGKGKDTQNAPALPHFPNTMSLKQLAILDDKAEKPTIETLLKQVPLPQEPIAVWGGPVLAVALASDTGSTGGSIFVAFQNANLQFFGWNIITPAPLSEADMAGLTTKAKEAAILPRLPTVGSTSATPAPSLYGVPTSSGVLWNAAQDRFIVLGNSALIVFGVTAPSSSSKKLGSTVVELARIPSSFASASWLKHMIAAVNSIGTISLIVPPVTDLSSPEAASASLTRGALKSTAVVTDLTTLTAGLQTGTWRDESLPRARRGTSSGAFSSPLALAANHLVTTHWVGSRGSPSGGSPTGLLFGTVPLFHPGLRALCAASALEEHEGDITARYALAASTAATFGNRLSATGQSGLSYYLSIVGNPTAALLLSDCDPSGTITVAMRARPETFARNFVTRLSLVDATTAIATIIDLIKTIDEEDLFFLSTSQVFDYSIEQIESRSSVVPLWMQVATFLSVAVSTFPAYRASAREALIMLCERLAAMGAAAEAALVTTVILPEDGEGGKAGQTSVDLLLKILRSSGPSAELLQQAYESCIG